MVEFSIQGIQHNAYRMHNGSYVIVWAAGDRDGSIHQWKITIDSDGITVTGFNNIVVHMNNEGHITLDSFNGIANVSLSKSRTIIARTLSNIRLLQSVTSTYDFQQVGIDLCIDIRMSMIDIMKIVAEKLLEEK